MRRTLVATRPARRVPGGLSEGAWFAGLAASLLPTVAGMLAVTMAAILSASASSVPEPPPGLTGYGRFNFRPEPDPRLFFAGAGAALLASVAVAHLWGRRLRRGEPGPARRWARLRLLALSAAATGGWVAAFAGGQRHVLRGEAPGAYVVVLLVIGGLAILAGVAGSKARFRGTPARAQPGSPAANRRFSPVDVAAPLFICAVVYVPQWRALAGHVYAGEHFFSWDFFSMGPALGFLHGAALPTTMHAPYGVGWPALFALASPVLPLSYGGMIHMSVLFGCAYFVGLYVLLRVLTRRPAWAAAGTLFALFLHLYNGLPFLWPLWRFPSLTVIRRPLDVWVLLALLLHLRTGRTAWAALAGALTGAAIVLATDSGLYLGAVVAVHLAWWAWSRDRGIRAPAAAAAAGGAVLVAGLGIASRWTMLEPRFWTMLFKPLVDGAAGFTALPLAGPLSSYRGGDAPGGASILLFGSVATVYLCVAAWALVEVVHRRAREPALFLGIVSLYGLMSLIHFVGRSDPLNLPHPLVPLAIVVAGLAALAHRAAGGAARSWTRAVPGVAAGVAVASLFANPGFRAYPGLLQSAWNGIPADGLCLVEAPVRDACALPPDQAASVAAFRGVVEEMRRMDAAGATVALLDHNDAAYYLAAGIAPWGPYSPLLANLFHTSQVDEVVARLVDERPEVVLIRPLGDNSYLADVRQRLIEVLERDYVPVRTLGPFQVWNPRPSSPEGTGPS